MRTKFPTLVGAGVLLLFSAIPATAHHSFAAEFDASRPIKLSGTSSAWSSAILTRGSTSRSRPERARCRNGPWKVLRRTRCCGAVGIETRCRKAPWSACKAFRQGTARFERPAATSVAADGKSLFVGSIGIGAPDGARAAATARRRRVAAHSPALISKNAYFVLGQPPRSVWRSGGGSPFATPPSPSVRRRARRTGSCAPPDCPRCKSIRRSCSSAAS